jgi:hypothetical protein
MRLQTQRARLRALSIAAAVAVGVGMTTVSFHAFAADGAAAIQPPSDTRLVGMFTVQSGVQTYTCANGKFSGPSTPEATLIDGANRAIHHFGGPSWQSTSDGSLVTAAKVAESSVPGAIPELLLRVNSRSGDGILGQVQFIQRLNTFGGTAPSRACNDGDKESVPYNANYLFFA